MPADLLRRAATKLREYATAVAEADTFTDGVAWTVEDDAEDSNAPYVVANFTDFSTAYLAEGLYSRAHADYMALLHPPVALALADLIDEGLDYASMREPERYPIYVKAVAAARAVLREPEETS